MTERIPHDGMQYKIMREKKHHRAPTRKRITAREKNRVAVVRRFQ